MPASTEREADLSDKVFAGVQYALPTHLISRFIHWFMRIRTRWLKLLQIRIFMRVFDIELADAQIQNLNRFEHFNDFFTRALLPNARPFADDPETVLCPADGVMSQFGDIHTGRIFQAKGHDYSAVELLGGDAERAAPFLGGRYATIYLAPANYHRVHMPLAGTLIEMVYVPGRLFSVNPATTRAVPRLFARNERVGALFSTSAGPMAVVLVGAMCVGSIETVWAGEVTPPHRWRQATHGYPRQGDGMIQLERGAELGRFNMGSTVILLFGPGAIEWAQQLKPDDELRMGQSLGTLRSGS